MMVWQFIIGIIVIMNKYWYLLFIVLIASCGIKSKYAISEKNKDIELYTTVYSANADSLFFLNRVASLRFAFDIKARTFLLFESISRGIRASTPLKELLKSP